LEPEKQALDPAILGRDFPRFKKRKREIRPLKQNERGSISKLGLGIFLLLATLCAFALYPLLTRAHPTHFKRPSTLRNGESPLGEDPSLVPKKDSKKPKKKKGARSVTRSPQTPKNTGGIVGEVRDLFERPIVGVHIQVLLGGKLGKPFNTTTMEDGRYRIPIEPIGPLFIFAHHPDFAPLPKPLFLEPKTKNAWLMAPKITLLSGRKIRFRFVDPEGHPISGVQALLQERLGAARGPFGDPPKEETSDRSGQVQFLGLPPGSENSRYQLRILPPPPFIRTLLRNWPASEGGSAIPVTLFEGITLRGRVEDAFGRPSIRAKVRALPLGSTPPPPISRSQIQKEGRRPSSLPTNPKGRFPIPFSVTCDDQGNFSLAGLPHGPCQIISHPNSPLPRVWVKKRVILPFEGLLLLRLPKGGRLEILLPPKAPFSSFTFLRSATGRSWDESSPWHRIPPSNSGTLHRDGLPREPLRLRLQNPLGFHFTSNTLDFENLDLISLDLRPLRTASLRGWLKGASPHRPGGPLLARLNSIRKEMQVIGSFPSNSSRIRVDPSGHFFLGPVPPGSYEILWGTHVIGLIQLAPGENIEKTFSLP
jgi:hypothetical protein